MQKIKKFFDKNRRDKLKTKYDFGHTLVVGGSLGMLGAAVLASKAALKIGAGVVTCAVPQNLILPSMSHFLEIMTYPIESEIGDFFDLKSLKSLKTFLEEKIIDCIVLGPGIGKNEKTVKFTQKFYEFAKNLNIPIILDADALFAFSNLDEKGSKKANFKLEKLPSSEKKCTIITPNEKEFEKLINAPNPEFVSKNRKEICKKIAKNNNLVCILKGHNTMISDGKTVFMNKTGNPGMATAGSGDVLCGILAGLKSQFKKAELLKIAEIGVFIHGLAGDIAKQKTGEMCLQASDIIENLPLALKKINKS